MKLIVGALIAVVLIAVSFIYVWRSQYRAASVVEVAPDAAGAEARGQGQRKRRINSEATPRLKRYDDARALVDDSQDVIVGVPVHQAAHLRAESSKVVLTDYRVQVLQVLKGDLEKGSLISVRTLGGSVSLADGTEVETRVPDFWKSPVKGQGYVLFLSRLRGVKPYYEVTGGPQGMFLISPWADEEIAESAPTQVVIPQVRPSDKLMKSYNGTKLDDFLGGLSKVKVPAAPGK